jgi:hypothetical protein
MKVLSTAKIGGGGDYVYRPRHGGSTSHDWGPSGRITVFDLDMLKPVWRIANASAHGAAVYSKSNHGLSSSSPLVMWDSNTLATLKTIHAQVDPTAFWILGDPFNGRVHVFSHGAPNATFIDAKSGFTVGTVVWAVRRNRPSATARADSMSILKIRVTSPLMTNHRACNDEYGQMAVPGPNDFGFICHCR